MKINHHDEEVIGPFLDAKSIEINSLELDFRVPMTQCGTEKAQGRKRVWHLDSELQYIMAGRI